MFILFLLLTFPLSLSPAKANAPQAEHSSEIRPAHVVVISIDGFQADMLETYEGLLPNLTALAAKGVMADGFIPTNPSLTWPNHTSMVTGTGSRDHSVIFNGMVERTGSGLPLRFEANLHQHQLVATGTIYDALYEAGLRTAAINWPATAGSTTIADNIPDVPDPIGEATEDFLWDLFDDELLDDFTSFALWQYDHAGRDQFWTNAAGWLIHNRMPDLLLLHLLQLDSMLHRNSTDSDEVLGALSNTDALIGKMVSDLKEAALYYQTALFIVSDHGMVNTPQTLLPNRLLQQNGMLEVSEDGQAIGGSAQVHAVGGFGMVYFQDPENDGFIEEVAALFAQTSGIARVLRQDEFERYGLPNPGTHPHAGQLALFSECGTSMNIALRTQTHPHDTIVPSIENDFALAHHGFFNECASMSGLFIGYGPGLQTETTVPAISIKDLAPTLGLLLGVPFETPGSSPLYEVLHPSLRHGQVQENP
ncbi:alkaline phosphatase family protein [Cyclonatronum proteinivorum]|uniref:alkaline phosphatase family protein n=1 Tax=Cyclonatronum proteinivorum TaxID=1457365 RepID=UPI0013DEFD70|nr:ectonucleotide pyrophosphatase/phosphodiesterase [Cyclonatronum proteinivorum]